MSDKPRWEAINALRLRCEYWWAASTILKTAHWGFAISTVVVAAISAGHPGSANAWPPETASKWTTAVVILAGLSGLLPWQTAGLAFERAHERLRDAIMLFDADKTYTVMHVLEAARGARDELNIFQTKNIGRAQTSQDKEAGGG